MYKAIIISSSITHILFNLRYAFIYKKDNPGSLSFHVNNIINIITTI